jgi:hypothetical protein
MLCGGAEFSGPSPASQLVWAVKEKGERAQIARATIFTEKVVVHACKVNRGSSIVFLYGFLAT